MVKLILDKGGSTQSAPKPAAKAPAPVKSVSAAIAADKKKSTTPAPAPKPAAPKPAAPKPAPVQSVWAAIAADKKQSTTSTAPAKPGVTITQPKSPLLNPSVSPSQTKVQVSPTPKPAPSMTTLIPSNLEAQGRAGGANKPVAPTPAPMTTLIPSILDAQGRAGGANVIPKPTTEKTTRTIVIPGIEDSLYAQIPGANLPGNTKDESTKEVTIVTPPPPPTPEPEPEPGDEEDEEEIIDTPVVTSPVDTSAPTPAPTPVPPAPPPSVRSRYSSEVISATPEHLVPEYEVNPELMARILFEDIGSQELLLLSRNDILNGKKISYQPISNIAEIDQSYSPDSILSASESFAGYFNNFTISLEAYIAERGSNSEAPNISSQASDGSLTLEFFDTKPDQRIEIQISGSAKLFDDTIY
jgi:hypothetical protein